MSKEAQKGSFVKQAAILAIAGILVRLLGFLYQLPLTNLIGDRGIAIYSAGYNIYNFLLILSSAGLPAAIGKMVSERLALKRYRAAHRVFRCALVFSGSFGFICTVILFLFARPIADKICNIPDSYYTLLTLAPTIFIVALLSVFRGYFQGMNTMMPTALSQIVEQIFNAIFSLGLAYYLVSFAVPEGEKNIPLGAAGGTAGTGIGAFFGLIVVFFAYALISRRLWKKIRLEGRQSRRTEPATHVMAVLLGTAIPIIIGTAIFSITNLMDMSMVTQRLSDSGAFTTEQVEILYGQLQGKYVRLTTLPVAISTAVATAAIPAIAASMVLKKKKDVRKKINLAVKVAMVISVPAAVGLGVLGDQVLLLLFPRAPEGGMLLRVGAVSIVFLALYQIITGALQGIGKIYAPVISAFFGAVTKIVLNYVLIAIPSINVLGAVYATIGCYVVASILNIIFLVKATGVLPNLLNGFMKPIIASGVMGVVCFVVYQLLFYILQSNGISTIAAIVIGAGVYGVVLVLIKGVSKEELCMLPAGGRICKLLTNMGLI